MAGIIVALDHPSAEAAFALVDRLGEPADFYKVGLELFARSGPDMVRELRGRGKRVFLDLKLHDIPNTVARAVESSAALDVEMLTVHIAGGVPMMEGARSAAAGRLEVLGVTVLTSLGPDDLAALWGHAVTSVRDEVRRLAALAFGCGLDGVVASAMEAGWVRASLEPPFLVVTPGIRPAGAPSGDQKRVATPTDAVAAGADWLVVGRPITQAADPAAAFSSIRSEVEAAEAPRAPASPRRTS